MEDINRSLLTDQEPLDDISGFREVQLLIERGNHRADQEERELEALDDAIVGTNRYELLELRESVRADMEPGPTQRGS